MTHAEFESLKADFLEWTGGFEPETEEDISAYVRASMSSDFADSEAAEALRQWMRESESLQVGRNVDQH